MLRTSSDSFVDRLKIILARVDFWLKVASGLSVTILAFLSTLYIADYFSPLCPSGRATQLAGPYGTFTPGGVAFIGRLPSFDTSADSPEAPRQSKLVLCENNLLLGPGHSIHAEIAKLGKGRYSHWKDAGLIFASSDNSDPNSNGRNYWVVSLK